MKRHHEIFNDVTLIRDTQDGNNYAIETFYLPTGRSGARLLSGYSEAWVGGSLEDGSSALSRAMRGCRAARNHGETQILILVS